MKTPFKPALYFLIKKLNLSFYCKKNIKKLKNLSYQVNISINFTVPNYL